MRKTGAAAQWLARLPEWVWEAGFDRKRLIGEWSLGLLPRGESYKHELLDIEGMTLGTCPPQVTVLLHVGRRLILSVGAYARQSLDRAPPQKGT